MYSIDENQGEGRMDIQQFQHRLDSLNRIAAEYMMLKLENQIEQYSTGKKALSLQRIETLKTKKPKNHTVVGLFLDCK